MDVKPLSLPLPYGKIEVIPEMFGGFTEGFEGFEQNILDYLKRREEDIELGELVYCPYVCPYCGYGVLGNYYYRWELPVIDFESFEPTDEHGNYFRKDWMETTGDKYDRLAEQALWILMCPTCEIWRIGHDGGNREEENTSALLAVPK